MQVKLPHTPRWHIGALLATAAKFANPLRLLSLAVFSFAILSAASSASAQAAATGTITGRVLNRTDGKYLNNARVTVKGTSVQSFTDDDGTFRLSNVPSGSVTIRVFFTGLEEKEINVVVTPGQTTQQDFELTYKGSPGESDTISLTEFVVQSSRETNGASIAVNEQRFSPNIKNVVSTDRKSVV